MPAPVTATRTRRSARSPRWGSGCSMRLSARPACWSPGRRRSAWALPPGGDSTSHHEPFMIHCRAASICPAGKCLISADTKCDVKCSATSPHVRVGDDADFLDVLVMISHEAKLVDHCPETLPSRKRRGFDDETWVHSMPSGRGLSAPVARSQASAVPSEGGLYRSGRPGGSWRRWALALDAGWSGFRRQRPVGRRVALAVAVYPPSGDHLFELRRR